MSSIKNINNNLIKGRYHFSGNIKIPVEIINSLSEKDRELIVNILLNLYSRILDLYGNAQNICVEYPLSINRTLYIDIKKHKLNFYIKDTKEKEFTQNLNLNDINKIIRAESIILTYVKNEANRESKNIMLSNLVSTLVHSAFDNKTHNRGSPLIQNCKLNDDFDLS